MRRSRVALSLALAAGALGACPAAASPSPDPTVTVARMLMTWQTALEKGARAAPARRYPTPPQTALAARLEAASEASGFKLVSVTMIHTVQDAPFIVARLPSRGVDSDDRRQALLTGVLSTLKSETGGQLYEGFFVEALDRYGAPFYARWSAGRARASGAWSSDPASGFVAPGVTPPLCRAGQASTRARPCTPR